MYFLVWKHMNFNQHCTENFAQIKNIPALVQIMAYRRPGEKPLPGPMTFSLLTHICVTWDKWVKWAIPISIEACNWTVYIIAATRLTATKADRTLTPPHRPQQWLYISRILFQTGNAWGGVIKALYIHSFVSWHIHGFIKGPQSEASIKDRDK